MVYFSELYLAERQIRRFRTEHAALSQFIFKHGLNPDSLIGKVISLKGVDYYNLKPSPKGEGIPEMKRTREWKAMMKDGVSPPMSRKRAKKFLEFAERMGYSAHVYWIVDDTPCGAIRRYFVAVRL